ncbi:DUF2207 family protein [Micromonospora sp. NPDC092111]|uniref:DUF2207 family protein n=1 Tax=Micromonospora sp. NPDC092111 TaxID=3364289 RepID=UPI003810A0D3
MRPVDALLEVGLPALCVAGWFAAYATLRLLTRPPAVASGQAAMDFPGNEPPAVVSLLANRWTVTVDAAEATLLDLAARGHLELRQAGDDPRHTTVHLTAVGPAGLNGYEHQVYQRVADRAVGGVVPLTALGFDSDAGAAAWARRFRIAVVADARRLGLSRRRFSAVMVTALCVLGGIVSLGVAAGAAHYLGRDDGDYGAVPGLFLVVTAIFCGIAGKATGERDTPAGRDVASRWLGLRAWLAAHESFADLPPAAVAVWDRYLPYGAAVGVTRVASQVIDLGRADRRRIWSSYTGTWRVVTVTYPSLLPRYGQRLGWIVFRAAVAAFVGWAFATPRDLWHRLFEAGTVTVCFTLFGITLLGHAAYLVGRSLLDAANPATVTGEVLWHQVWQSRQVGDDADRRTVPKTFYLVIDDGQTARTRAWVLPADIAAGCRVGDEITARVRPWTRRVLDVTVRRPAATAAFEDLPSTDDEELIAAAVAGVPSPATAAPVVPPADGSWVRPGDLLTVEEATRALGRSVRPYQVPMPAGNPLQAAGFDGSRGRPALNIEVSRDERAQITLAARRNLGTPVAGLAEEAYAGGDWLAVRRGRTVIVFTLGNGADGADPTVLPWLATLALDRLPPTAITT